MNTVNQTVNNISSSTVKDANKSEMETSSRTSSLYWKIVIGAIIIIIAFWAVAYLFYILTGVRFEANNLVLTFAGILATFIVISNYAQVKDIERKTDIQIQILQNEVENRANELQKNNKIWIEEINSKFTEIQNFRTVENELLFQNYILNFQENSTVSNLIRIFTFIRNEPKIEIKDNLSRKLAIVIDNSNLKVSEFEKKIIISSADLIYPFGNDIPQELRNAINNIAIK